jgi:hypothetical protein
VQQRHPAPELNTGRIPQRCLHNQRSWIPSCQARPAGFALALLPVIATSASADHSPCRHLGDLNGEKRSFFLHRTRHLNLPKMQPVENHGVSI